MSLLSSSGRFSRSERYILSSEQASNSVPFTDTYLRLSAEENSIPVFIGLLLMLTSSSAVLFLKSRLDMLLLPQLIAVSSFICDMSRELILLLSQCKSDILVSDDTFSCVKLHPLQFSVVNVAGNDTSLSSLFIEQSSTLSEEQPVRSIFCNRLE